MAFRLPADGAIDNVVAFTVSEYTWLLMYGPAPPVWSVAVTAKLNTPPAVGVPEITPPELSVKPAGRLPAVTA